jgi:hypothetical protein
MAKDVDGRAVLAVPMNPDRNDAGADSVCSYLVALLREVWEHKEGFGGKRPFGNSGWQFELYDALARVEMIDGTFDEYDCLDDVDDQRGDELIALAITELR